MAPKRYSDKDLQNIACDVLTGLKGKGFRIRDLRKIFLFATEALEYIHYGDIPEEASSADENTAQAATLCG